MANQDLPPVPYSASVISSTGLLVPVWAAWFRSLFNRVGGFNGSPIIQDGSITTQLLADGSVTSSKIASASVTTSKLASSSVTSSAIATGAVGGSALASGAVTYDKITSLRKVTGSTLSPVAIAAATGITPSNVADELIYISGSGGHVDITASPQIAAGTAVGQRLTLRVPTGSNGVLLEDGNGISQNGPADLGVDTFSISYEWDGSVWVCTGRD